jgi:hypothetical protein
LSFDARVRCKVRMTRPLTGDCSFWSGHSRVLSRRWLVIRAGVFVPVKPGCNGSNGRVHDVGDLLDGPGDHCAQAAANCRSVISPVGACTGRRRFWPLRLGKDALADACAKRWKVWRERAGLPHLDLAGVVRVREARRISARAVGGVGAAAGVGQGVGARADRLSARARRRCDRLAGGSDRQGQGRRQAALSAWRSARDFSERNPGLRSSRANTTPPAWRLAPRSSAFGLASRSPQRAVRLPDSLSVHGRAPSR